MDADVIEPGQPAKPDRTLLAVLIAVGLLVVIALVVVLVRSGVRESLDPSTPEGVVQRYAQAVLDGDDEAAGEYVASTGSSEECDYYERGDLNLRLTFQETDISGSHATVRVSMTQSYGGDLFSNYDYSWDADFTLVKSGDSWLIEETPYEFMACGVAVGK